MIKLIFFASMFFIWHAYIGYPISLLIISIIKKKNVNKDIYIPSVTVIITVYNEEKKIEAKIVNMLEIDYPKDKIQIIFSSDGSTDRTNEIISRYFEKGIELLNVPIRGGKENAQKEALKKATGDIIIFTDVATILDSTSERNCFKLCRFYCRMRK